MPMVLPNPKDNSIDGSDSEYMEDGDLFSVVYEEEDDEITVPYATLGEPFNYLHYVFGDFRNKTCNRVTYICMF